MDGKPGQPVPLIPLGTASGGVATTYLVQVVNPATLTATDDEGFLSLVGTRLSTTPVATIVASASGWVEQFAGGQGGALACNLVSSAFGDCIVFNSQATKTVASGPPTPKVFQVSSTVSPVTTTSSVASNVPISAASPAPLTPTSSAASTTASTTASTSTSLDTSTQKLPAAKTGPLVAGVVVGGFALLATIVALCVYWRRRRSRLAKLEDGIKTTVTGTAAEPWSWEPATRTRGFESTDTREVFAPQPVRAPVPSWGKSSIGMTACSPETDVGFSAPTDSYSEVYSKGYTNAY